MSYIQFFIVEKSYIVRTGLETIIADLPDTRVAVRKSSFDAVRELVCEQNPHVLLINLKLFPNANQDIKAFFGDKLQTRYIALAGTNKKMRDSHTFDVIINIDSDKTGIIDSISALIEEEGWREDPDKSSELSEREQDVVREIALGRTNKEIGDRLFISTHTVVTHRKNITRKLGIKTVSGLTVYALLNKIINIDEVDAGQ